jgi:toxin HigB-1
MIVTFGSKGTADLYHGINSRESRKIPNQIWRVARRKLDMLEAAHALCDLKIPPANRLETLKGKHRAQYSIRINNQYRLVFRFQEGNAHDVEITDYH